MTRTAFCRKSPRVPRVCWLGSWALGTSDRRSTSGWQGKSAAFGLAHVVDGIDILRCEVSGNAASAWLNLKEIKAARAVNPK
jgi:hypothetical protein